MATAAVNFVYQGAWYGPDYTLDVPAEVAKNVGGHVLDLGDPVEAEPTGQPAAAALPDSPERDDALTEQANGGGAPAGVVGSAPSRRGAGSGLEAWRAYADANGVEVDQDATRDEAIAACEAAGLPVG